MAVEFALSDWSGWTTPALVPPHASAALRISDAPDASGIPALLRRRLNTLGRAAAAETLRFAEHEDGLPMVYSSRHGDLERTLTVLCELAAGEPVSPMSFSLSVHNAIPGIMSIHSGNTANITSIAALEESLVPVLLEAIGLLGEGHPRVLCLLADAPVPEIYRASCSQPLAPYAASFIVSTDQGRPVRLEHRGTAATDIPARASSASKSPVNATPEALRFVEFLSSDTGSFDICHNGGSWTLTKR